MSEDFDDEATKPGVVLGDIRRSRHKSAPRIVEARRRSVGHDLAELALEELRAIDGVHIPQHAHMEAHAHLRQMGQRFYEQGERVAETSLARMQTEAEELRAQALRYERDLQQLRMRVLQAGRDEITVRELVNLVLGGPKGAEGVRDASAGRRDPGHEPPRGG